MTYTSKCARRLCLSYFALLLFVLLFIGNPLKFVEQSQFVSAYHTIEPWLHVGLFALLAFLVCASRWPVHIAAQAGSLVLFAAASELVQFLLPNRSPRLGCFVQDVTGLIIGASAWFMLVDFVRSLRRSFR